METGRRTRHLPLEGTHNLRDIGGYPTRDGRTTRWGQLFRSDSLHCLSPSGQALLIEQGLRTVIDLRHDTELQKAPNVFAASDAVAYVNIPLFADLTPRSGMRASVNTLADLYKTALDTCGRPLAEAFTVLSNGGFPALIHLYRREGPHRYRRGPAPQPCGHRRRHHRRGLRPDRNLYPELAGGITTGGCRSRARPRTVRTNARVFAQSQLESLRTALIE